MKFIICYKVESALKDNPTVIGISTFMLKKNALEEFNYSVSYDRIVKLYECLKIDDVMIKRTLIKESKPVLKTPPKENIKWEVISGIPILWEP